MFSGILFIYSCLVWAYYSTESERAIRFTIMCSPTSNLTCW